MDEFSFAYMQEAFVATLLVLARGDEPERLMTRTNEGNKDGPENYEFYQTMKEQVKILRDDMGKSSTVVSDSAAFHDEVSSIKPMLSLEGEYHSQVRDRCRGHRTYGIQELSGQHQFVESRQTSGDIQALHRYFPVRERVTEE